MKLTLIEKRSEVGDVVTFIFKPEEKLVWRAGQYLHYTLPHGGADDRGEKRYFTIASAPHEGHVQITTRISSKHSTFKDHLNLLAVGESIEAEGLEGDFVVEDPAREMVLIAGGIGITPYRAMLLDMDHKGQVINAKLLYANRDENFVFQDELEALRAKHPYFSIQYFTGDRHIDELAIRREVSNLTTRLFYISGPEPMVKSLAEVLGGMGVPQEKIKLDDFPGYTWP